jgi:hypothetical protein
VKHVLRGIFSPEGKFFLVEFNLGVGRGKRAMQISEFGENRSSYFWRSEKKIGGRRRGPEPSERGGRG